jgi:hypothetical protein
MKCGKLVEARLHAKIIAKTSGTATQLHSTIPSHISSLLWVVSTGLRCACLTRTSPQRTTCGVAGWLFERAS